MACYNRFFLKHRGLAPIGGILFADSCEAQAVTAQPREKNQPPTWAGGAPGFLGHLQQIWLVVYLPLWKIWKSVGMIFPFPIYGKVKFMFQTTYQKWVFQAKNCGLKQHQPDLRPCWMVSYCSTIENTVGLAWSRQIGKPLGRSSKTSPKIITQNITQNNHISKLSPGGVFNLLGLLKPPFSLLEPPCCFVFGANWCRKRLHRKRSRWAAERAWSRSPLLCKTPAARSCYSPPAAWRESGESGTKREPKRFWVRYISG